MTIVPFAPWAPDLSDLNKNTTSTIANVLPRLDGYGPVCGPEAFSNSVGAVCRGYFQALETDGTVVTFAGTETQLYVLDNTTLAWTLVSLGGGPYAGLTADANWQFAQFNSIVIAVQANVAPQSWTLGSSSAFAALGGSPPQAGGITVINRFVVLYDLLSNPYRIHWSGLNATTTWTSGTNYSDYQDLPDGGRVRGVAGGEYGLILQQRAIRRMVFVPGAAITFQIERIAADRGIFAPYSLCQGGERIFFASTNGFVEASGDGSLKPIGFEKVDRTFLDDVDEGNLQLCIGAVDPQRYLVVFAYKSIDGTTGQFDKAIAYNWQLERWTPFTLSGEYMSNASLPGLTLEGLDAIAPGAATVSGAANNGAGLVRLTVSSTSGWSTGDYKTVRSIAGTTEANGSWTITVINATTVDLQGTTYANAYVSGGIVAGDVDQLTISLDNISTVARPGISIFDVDHKLSFLTGDELEATLETAETIGTRTRVNVNGAQPITDAASCYVSVGGREVLNGALTYGDETQIDTDGYCPVLANVRSGRIRLRIPAGETWTFASGVDPELAASGRF